MAADAPAIRARGLGKRFGALGAQLRRAASVN